MRATDMVIGDEYALSGRRDYVRVTVLATDPEVCGRGWVEVRFEEGILTGQVKRVSSGRIIGPWTEDEEPQPPTRKRRPRQVVVRGPWPPEAGQPIFWHKTGEVQWMVEEVDRRHRMATIAGELVGQKQRHTLSWEELQPFETRIEPESVEADHEPVGIELPHLEPVEREPQPVARERERLADVEAESDVDGPLERFVARLVFSPDALERYRRRFVKSAGPVEARRRLYQELHRRGTLFRRPFRAPGAATSTCASASRVASTSSCASARKRIPRSTSMNRTCASLVRGATSAGPPSRLRTRASGPPSSTRIGICSSARGGEAGGP